MPDILTFYKTKIVSTSRLLTFNEEPYALIGHVRFREGPVDILLLKGSELESGLLDITMIDEVVVDFELFTAEEIGIIYAFFHLIEETKTKRVDKKHLEQQYKQYRTTINSIRLEKKYDALLKKAIGVSIYQTMSALRGRS